jgi:hypothetical protein
MSEFFCFQDEFSAEKVRALGLHTDIWGSELDDDFKGHLCLTVLPMGSSWVFWIVLVFS